MLQDKPIMSVTPEAANRLKAMLAKKEGDGTAKPLGVKIDLKTRGCAGNSYMLSYVEAVDPTDFVVKPDDTDLAIYVSNKVAMSILGTVMDYQDGEMRSGFVFNNPQAKSTCGCGKSFKV